MNKLIILGAGTPTPTRERFGSSVVLSIEDELIMFDCGPASTHKLIKKRILPTQVNSLFFSHHHFDHNVDYPCFLLSRWDQGAGKEKKLKVFGPNLTEKITEQLIGSEGVFSYDWKARVNHPLSQKVYQNRGGVLPRKPPSVLSKDIQPGSTQIFDKFEVHSREAKHVQPYLDSLAYRLDSKKNSIVYTGDTSPCEEVEELSYKADVMICMCWDDQNTMNEVGEDEGQCGTIGAAMMASKAQVKHLVLTHLGPNIHKRNEQIKSLKQMRKIFPGKITFSNELEEIGMD
jgi:ribonuclease BN (tRNA processing enzyme)